MLSNSKSGLFVFGALLAAALAACGSPGDGPASRLEVANDRDNFVYLAQSYDRYITDTKRFGWQHTFTVGQVNEQSAITEGTLLMTIRDANGAQLYASDTKGMAKFLTAAGTTGDWTIEVSANRVRGDILFSISKPDST
jgi:hypothetical protein